MIGCVSNGVTAWEAPNRPPQPSMRNEHAAPGRLASPGFDAGEKVKGRKRHLVVYTLRLVMAGTVTAASAQGRALTAPVVAPACTSSPHPAEPTGTNEADKGASRTIKASHALALQIQSRSALGEQLCILSS